MVMSSEKTSPQNVSARPAKSKFKIGGVVEAQQAVIERIDITSLQIDESYEADCDPYNSTGQFLAGAVRKKYDE